MSVEDFGVEDFGAVAPDATAEVTAEPDRAELEALIVELNNQIAGTMDELEIKRLRNAKRGVQEQLGIIAVIPGSSKTATQWNDLTSAYREFYPIGSPDATGVGAYNPLNAIIAERGTSDATFEYLREELSKAHAAKSAVPTEKTKRTRAPNKPKEPVPPPLRANERFVQIVKHAENLGFDGQAIWDELGSPDISDATLGVFLDTVNLRGFKIDTSGNGMSAAISIDVQEFGASLDARTDNTPAAGVEADNAPLGATTAFFTDAAFAGLIDPETGAVVDRPWILDAVGLLDFPDKPNKGELDKIIDAIRTKWLDPAARYRAQAEKLAGAKEKRAAMVLEVFGKFIDACGAEYLPRYQSDSKEGSKSQHKKGDFSGKTLVLTSGSIGWTKDGDIAICDSQPQYRIWLDEMKQKMQILRQAGTPEAAEELTALEADWGFQLKTEIVPDMTKLKSAKELPPGWVVSQVNEFGRRSLK